MELEMVLKGITLKVKDISSIGISIIVTNILESIEASEDSRESDRCSADSSYKNCSLFADDNPFF